MMATTISKSNPTNRHTLIHADPETRDANGTGSGVDTSSSFTRAEDEVFDFYIDTCYMKKEKNKAPTPDQIERFAREPWKPGYCDADDHIRPHVAVDVYMSLRYGKREEFYSKKTDDDRKHIDHEIKRIEKARRAFRAWDLKKQICDDLDKSREKWRVQVKQAVDDNERFQEFSNRIVEDFDGQIAVVRHMEQLQRELRRLKGVIETNRSKFQDHFGTLPKDRKRSSLRDDHERPSKDYVKAAREFGKVRDAMIKEWREKDLELKRYEKEHPLPRKPEYIATAISTTEPDHGSSEFEERCKSMERKRAWDEDLLRRLRAAANRQLGTEGQEPIGTANASEAEAEAEAIERSERKERLYDLNASAIYFAKENNSPYFVGHTEEHKWFRHKGSNQKYPNQKIPAYRLLKDAGLDNPLRRKTDFDVPTIRWFHFPTNNMHFVERAIARYYGEDPDTIDISKPDYEKPTCTEKLLAREFWQGQMHGLGDHEGFGIKGPVHARHMRSKCSVIPKKDEPTTSSTGTIPGKHSTKHNLALFMPYLHWESSSRRAKMVDIVNEVIPPDPLDKDRLVPVIRRAQDKHKPRKSTYLGEYLMNVARVAQEMDYEIDEHLLRDHLKGHAPLHIRRTLDQYYFLTLENTAARDRSQVVYRGTKAGKSFHSKNVRVVMVDQLWLWILDDNTIITSFPRRWGRNKPDPSGVHKSLRERLGHGNDQIKSIWHLALIIVDQSSRVFFDRTKPLDERPEVMDLFGSAIGQVSEFTSRAYGQFWRNTLLHRLDLLDERHRRYLDINPEGIILQEAQDIVEELQIMSRIYREQYAVMREFRRHLGHLNGEQRHEKGETAAVMRKLATAIEDLPTAINNQRFGIISAGTGSGRRGSFNASNAPAKDTSIEETIQEADHLLETIKNRRAEIDDLEDSATRVCDQLSGLLSLMQQQASIIEAKAALLRADESIKQGHHIMAFTVITIFFLPLGFFAGFFGMNNSVSTENDWMSLNEQIAYMFGLSAVVIAISVSMAFNSWTRAMIPILCKYPTIVFFKWLGVYDYWRRKRLDHVSIEDRIKARLETKLEKMSKGAKQQKEAGCGAGNSTGTGLEFVSKIKGRKKDNELSMPRYPNRKTTWSVSAKQEAEWSQNGLKMVNDVTEDNLGEEGGWRGMHIPSLSKDGGWRRRQDQNAEWSV